MATKEAPFNATRKLVYRHLRHACLQQENSSIIANGLKDGLWLYARPYLLFFNTDMPLCAVGKTHIKPPHQEVTPNADCADCYAHTMNIV